MSTNTIFSRLSELNYQYDSNGTCYHNYKRSFIVDDKSYIVNKDGCFLITHEITDKKFGLDLYLKNPNIELKSRSSMRKELISSDYYERYYREVPHTDYYSDYEEPKLIMTDIDNVIYYGEKPIALIPASIYSNFWYGELLIVDKDVYMKTNNNLYKFISNMN